MPPFDLNLFASNAIFNMPLPQLYRGVVPFFFIYLIVLALITYIPALTLAPWLSIDSHMDEFPPRDYKETT